MLEFEIDAEELRQMRDRVTTIAGREHPATLYTSRLVEAHTLIEQSRLKSRN